jgi:hypothetical protein
VPATGACRAIFGAALVQDILASRKDGDKQSVVHHLRELGADARKPGERIASTDICTNGRKIPVAFER